ncbi:MAG TPA: hypothetical protein DCZ05_05840 [Deltaproteobacteria bacterium]|nr:MAG: hypothetical protein A2253_01540 [Deltaproteobacteria bacterium RIFOXYA2_FULL_55_11]HBA39259.1 hypothetical protein [Deltaproteobacteria bacterium]
MGNKNKDKKKVRKLSRKRKRLYMGGVVVALVAGLLTWNRISTRVPTHYSAAEETASSGYVRRETRTPLSPALFVGKTATAYRVAQEIPDVLDQLYCYCECDKHMGHLTLLSCFVDSHAAT